MIEKYQELENEFEDLKKQKATTNKIESEFYLMKIEEDSYKNPDVIKTMLIDLILKSTYKMYASLKYQKLIQRVKRELELIKAKKMLEIYRDKTITNQDVRNAKLLLELEGDNGDPIYQLFTDFLNNLMLDVKKLETDAGYYDKNQQILKKMYDEFLINLSAEKASDKAIVKGLMR